MSFKRDQFVLALFLLSILFILSGCSEDETNKAPGGNSKIEVSATDFVVTFVELGSVKCIPCKKMQPIMEEIEKEYEGKVNVVFHDVWTETGKPFAEKYGIRVIPTQVFLDENGKEFHRHQGFYPKTEIVELLKKRGL